jgi:hypothetical protein
MSRLTITLELGNEAMQTPDDITDALLRTIARIQDGHKEGNIRDVNGNTVGSFSFETANEVEA